MIAYMRILKRVKRDFITMLLRTTSLVAIGVFLFNIIYTDLAWAKPRGEVSYLLRPVSAAESARAIGRPLRVLEIKDSAVALETLREILKIISAHHRQLRVFPAYRDSQFTIDPSTPKLRLIFMPSEDELINLTPLPTTGQAAQLAVVNDIHRLVTYCERLLIFTRAVIPKQDRDRAIWPIRKLEQALIHRNVDEISRLYDQEIFPAMDRLLAQCKGSPLTAAGTPLEQMRITTETDNAIETSLLRPLAADEGRPRAAGERLASAVSIQKRGIINLTEENVGLYAEALAEIDRTRSEEGENFGEVPWDANRFTENFRRSTGTTLTGKWRYSMIALVDDRPAGYLIGINGGVRDFNIPDDALHLLRIAVTPAYRSTKIGASLVREFALKAQRENIKDMYVEVNSIRPGAIKFYERCGFKEESRRPYDLNEKITEIRMKASVADLLANLAYLDGNLTAMPFAGKKTQRDIIRATAASVLRPRAAKESARPAAYAHANVDYAIRNKIHGLLAITGRINPSFSSLYGNEGIRRPIRPHKRSPEANLIATAKCQLTCAGCFFGDIMGYCRQHPEVQFDIQPAAACRLADYFDDHKIVVLGGEPFDWGEQGHEHLKEFIAAQRKKNTGEKVEIFTNCLKLMQQGSREGIRRCIFGLLLDDGENLNEEKAVGKILYQNFTLKITLSLEKYHRSELFRRLRKEIPGLTTRDLTIMYNELVEELLDLERRGVIEVNFNAVHEDISDKKDNDPLWIAEWLRNNFGGAVAALFQKEADEIAEYRRDRFEHFDLNLAIGGKVPYNPAGFIANRGHMVFMHEYRYGFPKGILALRRLYPPRDIPQPCIVRTLHENSDTEGGIDDADFYMLLLEGYLGRMLNFSRYPFMREFCLSLIVTETGDLERARQYRQEAINIYEEYKRHGRVSSIFERLLKERDHALVFEWLNAFAEAEAFLEWEKDGGAAWQEERLRELREFSPRGRVQWELYNQPLVVQKAFLERETRLKMPLRRRIALRLADDFADSVVCGEVPYSYKDGSGFYFTVDTGFGIVGDNTDNSDFSRCRYVPGRDVRLNIVVSENNMGVGFVNLNWVDQRQIPSESRGYAASAYRSYAALLKYVLGSEAFVEFTEEVKWHLGEGNHPQIRRILDEISGGETDKKFNPTGIGLYDGLLFDSTSDTHLSVKLPQLALHVLTHADGQEQELREGVAARLLTSLSYHTPLEAGHILRGQEAVDCISELRKIYGEGGPRGIVFDNEHKIYSLDEALGRLQKAQADSRLGVCYCPYSNILHITTDLPTARPPSHLALLYWPEVEQEIAESAALIYGNLQNTLNWLQESGQETAAGLDLQELRNIRRVQNNISRTEFYEDRRGDIRIVSTRRLANTLAELPYDEFLRGLRYAELDYMRGKQILLVGFSRTAVLELAAQAKEIPKGTNAAFTVYNNYPVLLTTDEEALKDSGVKTLTGEAEQLSRSGGPFDHIFISGDALRCDPIGVVEQACKALKVNGEASIFLNNNVMSIVSNGRIDRKYLSYELTGGSIKEKLEESGYRVQVTKSVLSGLIFLKITNISSRARPEQLLDYTFFSRGPNAIVYLSEGRIPAAVRNAPKARKRLDIDI